MGRGYVRDRPERQPDLATEAQVQAMQAKLAKRVKEVGSPVVTSSPRDLPPPARLEWERPTKDAMAVKTKCGRYSCAKVIVMGKTSYELWKLVSGGGWFTQLHKGLDNFLQAQELARQDAQKRV